MQIFETSVVPDDACGDQVAVMRVHACAHVVLHVLAYRSHKNHVLSLSPVSNCPARCSAVGTVTNYAIVKYIVLAM